MRNGKQEMYLHIFCLWGRNVTDVVTGIQRCGFSVLCQRQSPAKQVENLNLSTEERIFTCYLLEYHSWPTHRRENPYAGLKSGTRAEENVRFLEWRKITRGACGVCAVQQISM